ncbi:MAG: ferredoxin [Thermodesulfobacteriota bacterium]|nr:ferredoxin [Thermodesulfobacteriota bacterium]
MKRVPVVDIGECSDCECCLELCSEVFRKNEMGYIEVTELPEYPEAAVEEAMHLCPSDCIAWEEIEGGACA